MNLQALYDLKERLEHAAIAGTSLLQEDFRLRRAVDALAPLAKANPVFAKISAGTKALLTAPEQERSTKLLDVLSLVDAVVYTQGVSNVSGDLIEAESGSGSYVQVSYGQLQPLLSALSGTGSGRTALIRETWQSQPELFGDFRVLPQVVSALGDNYGELAELIGEILLKQGENILPLLKKNFDPAGKGEMARRVRLVAKLAGERENGWFVSVLPDSAKDVREAIIQALSLSQDNAQLLIDLCQSERGKLKEAALRSLAAMQTQQAEAFWAKEVQKKPNLVTCLRGVNTQLAADLCAAALRTFLENLLAEGNVYDQPDLDQIIQLTSAAVGKYSANMDSLWHWIADRMEQFAAIVPDKNVRLCDMTVAEHLQRTLMQTILWNSGGEVLALAKELAAQNREWFLGCGMLADMAVLSAGALYDTYAPYIASVGILHRESTFELRCRIQIMQALSTIRWNREKHCHCVVFSLYDSLHGAPLTAARKLDGVDSRWVQRFTDPKVRKHGAIFALNEPNSLMRKDPAVDEVITALINPEDPEVCRLAGEWFCAQLRKSGDLQRYFTRLQFCGWSKWKGILAECAQKNGIHSFDMVISLLRRLPMTNLEKAAELKQLDSMAKDKSLKIRYGPWPGEWVMRQICILENDSNAEL